MYLHFVYIVFKEITDKHNDFWILKMICLTSNQEENPHEEQELMNPSQTQILEKVFKEDKRSSCSRGC